MSSFAIVIHFHILEDLSFCFIPGFELCPVNQLHFKRMEKTLCDGVIPAVALLAHTADELILSQYCLEVIAGILTTERIRD